MGTVLLLARLLPPLQFGLFATAMSISYIATLFADFGFVIRALREIGAHPENASVIMAAAVRGKMILTIAVSAIAAITCLFLPLEKSALIVVSIIWIATFLNSFGDTALVAFRSLRAFDREVRVIAVTFAIHMAIMLTGYILHLPLLWIACLYLATRAIYTFVAFRSLVSICPLQGLLSRNLSDFFHLLRSSVSYAIDSILTNVLAQLDGILVPALLGLHAAGIYQAGSRLVQGLLLFSAILSTYHIPQMSYEHSQGRLQFRTAGLRVMAEFGGLGLVGALSFVIGGPIYVAYFLDPSYADLNHLWLGFAAFAVARFLTGGLGSFLVANGMSYIRPLCTFFAGCVTIGLYFLLLPSFGLAAVPWVTTSGTIVLLAGYIIITLRINSKHKDLNLDGRINSENK